VPIDTATVRFAAGALTEPILDFKTRQPKTDENCGPLFNVLNFDADSGVKGSISINVTGAVTSLNKFMSAMAMSLITAVWEVRRPTRKQFRRHLRRDTRSIQDPYH